MTAFSGLEIVVGDAHLLAVDQALQVLVDQRQVQRLWRFEIIVAELVLGMQFQVKEIVVDVERNQAESNGREALAQLDGAGRLAR